MDALRITGRRAILRVVAVAAVAAVAALLGLAVLSGPAGAAALPHRLGRAPALPRGAARVGRLASRTAVTVDVTLKPRDAAALSAYATAVSTPHSADYHRYLTRAQFRARFAPTAAQVAAVRAGLRADGLDPSRVSANGLLLTVHASAGALALAFHTNFDSVALASRRLAYANTSAPQLSGRLAGLVQGVVGLSDLTVPHPAGLERRTSPARGDARGAEATSGGASVQPCATAQATSTGTGPYTADEVAGAYGLDSLYAQGDYGAGETVALMEFEPFEASDIQTYNSCYGIDGSSTSDVNTIDVATSGDGTGAGGTDQSGDGSGEAVLDIEQVLGLAPQATVDVYEAPMSEAGDLDAFTDMVDNPSVDVISTSWGTCEPELDSSVVRAEETIFEQAATEGISVYAAAGDEGSTACDGSGYDAATPAVDDPASDPWVTSVGGTELPSESAVSSQTAWNESASGYGAGGGGVSALWTMPSYQSGAASALGIIGPGSSSGACHAPVGSDCREVPDVSADADPITGYDFYFSDGGGQTGVDDPSGWEEIGGTSAATPLWAALTALADASGSCHGSTLGFPNPLLYAIAGNASEDAGAFTDVTSGNIDYSPSGYLGGLFSARTGYDMATGLGTPNAAALAPDMCGEAAALGQGASGRTSSSSYPAPASPAPTTTTTTTTTSPTTSTPSGGSGNSSAGSGSGSGTSSGSESGASNPTVTISVSSSAPTTQANASSCPHRTTALHSRAFALALSRTRHSAEMSLALDLAAGCERDTLSLDRAITTAARRRGAVAWLKIQLLSSSGKLLATLSTMSNATAAHGFGGVTLNLSAYAGEKLTLRFLATGKGPSATTFSLRSLALSQS